MKYVKDNRTLHTKDEFRVDEKWFYGLRMAEQDININKDNNSYRGDTIEEHIHELEKLDINSKI